MATPSSLIGQTVSHYRIIEKLGGGGMGVVYVGEDLLLGRKVAIKTLQPALMQDINARARFVQEARAAARVAHPNIAVVYEAGEMDNGTAFLAMEFVPGETLSQVLARGPLSSSRVADIGEKLASALAHAHARGILHRDIKSSNIILTTENEPKVLDFGLASVLRSDQSTTRLTLPGTFVGTLHYAAPEVVSGREADARSDIYSLAVVLYELACGELPFTRLTGAALTAAILQGKAPPAVARNSAVSGGLSEVIARAMAVDPDDRFSSAQEFAEALRERSGARTTASKTGSCAVAIVDFQNLSGESGSEWLATGITESLTADLRKLKSVRVVSRERVRAALQELGDDAGCYPDLAKRLRADWIISGTYQRAGTRVRITPRLAAAGNDEVLGCDKVDGTWDEIFDLQDRVTAKVMDSLRLSADAAAQDRIAAPETLHLEAYEQYSLGRQKLQQMGKTSLEEGRQHFERAVALDPQYAMAHAGLGSTHAMRYIHRTDPNDLTKAQAHLERACELDPELAEPYPWLCYVYMRQGRIEDSLRTGERAVQLQPDSVEAHYFLAVAHYTATDTGLVDYQSAVDHLLKAIRIAPHWQPAYAVLAALSLLNGKYDHAEQFAGRLRELNQTPVGTRFLGAELFLAIAALRRGDFAAAEQWNTRSFECLSAVDHAYRDAFMALTACGIGDVHLRQGRADLALVDFRRAWQILKEYPRMLGRERVTVRALAGLAAGYAAQGDDQRARELLAQANSLLSEVRLQSACPASEVASLWYSVAVTHAGLREAEAALQTLQEAVRTGWRDAGWLERDSALGPVRNLPGFHALLDHLRAFPEVTLQVSSTMFPAPLSAAS